MLRAGFDPDQLLGYVQAYAGQVALADLCLGMLLEALDVQERAEQPLFAVTSPRGFPLGEHLRVGACDEALYGELLHVPLIVRLPGRQHALARCQRLMQPHELGGLIAECCGWGEGVPTTGSSLLAEIEGARPSMPRAACSFGRGQRSIRTPAWFLREEQPEAKRYELFAKPDDRWEANEVAARCGEVVELLAAELDRFEQAARSGQLSQSTPLAEQLYELWR